MLVIICASLMWVFFGGGVGVVDWKNFALLSFVHLHSAWCDVASP